MKRNLSGGSLLVVSRIMLRAQSRITTYGTSALTPSQSKSIMFSIFDPSKMASAVERSWAGPLAHGDMQNVRCLEFLL